MMKRLFILFFIGVTSLSWAQQLPHYTQWATNQFALNPAHAGIKKCIDISTLYRNQWVGFEGAPKTGFLAVSIPLNSKRKQYLSARQGTGFKFETDRIGQFNTNRINVAYAAHFNFNKFNRLSLGLYGGVVQMGYDPSSATTQSADPTVLQQSNFVAPDASFGAWFNAENYFVGLTLRNLIPTKWKDIGSDSRFRFHLGLNAGYRFIIKKNITLMPAINIRIPPRGIVDIDYDLFVNYKNFIGFGVGYRTIDALLLFFNVKIAQQFSIGYSYDINLTDIQQGAKNTHEISLRFTTCKPDRRTSNSCPLFE